MELIKSQVICVRTSQRGSSILPHRNEVLYPNGSGKNVRIPGNDWGSIPHTSHNICNSRLSLRVWKVELCRGGFDTLTGGLITKVKA